MQTSNAAVTAFAGSLFLVSLILGPSQAGSPPDLKSAVNASHDGIVSLVGGGRGGGGHGGGSHGGGQGGGAMLVVDGEARWAAAGVATWAAVVLNSSATGVAAVPAPPALVLVAAFPRTTEETGTTRLTLLSITVSSKSSITLTLIAVA
jgi:hypothetical protein